MTRFKKILVRFPNWLGDMLMALPLVEALKQAYPDVEIHALMKKPFDQLFEHDSRFAKIIPFEKEKQLFKKLFPKNLRQTISKERYDAAFVLTRSFSSMLVLKNVKHAIGTKRFLGSLFLDHQVKFANNAHQRSKYLSFLKPLGIDSDKIMSYLPHLDCKSDLKWKSFGLDVSKPFIIFHPGASYGSAKTWPLESFETLALSLLEEKQIQIVFCGDIHQKPPSLSSPFVIDLCGQTSILELCELIQKAKLIVCNDSGPMHLADVLKTPLISLFGSTDPNLTGPKNNDSLVIFQKTDCGPCFKRICPLDHACMKGISPQKVLTHIMEKIG